MKDPWYLIREGTREPASNMAFDEALLEAVHELARPILRLYGWAVPSATFGYFQKYEEVASWTELRPLIRRPTGGGLVPHAADWTYSLVVPPQHPWHQLRAEESYRRTHAWISSSLRQLRIPSALAATPIHMGPGQCFIGAEKFDVLADGRKIAGAAQKRNKFGLLVQGSLQPSPEWKRGDWEEALIRCGSERLGAEWTDLLPSEAIIARTETLVREKYGTTEYNQRR
jgi:lipoate-protein ligase A